VPCEAWLQRSAALYPERTAVEDPEASLSYGELFARARRVAGWLAREGVRPGGWVAVEAVGGLPFAAALHGILLAGCVAVPLDPRFSAAERELIAGRCELVFDPAEAARAAAGEGPFAYRLDDGAVVIHTSGTTGRPRPVLLTYRNLLFNALGSAALLGLDPGERWLCALPLSHVGGLTILTRSAIYGTTAVVHPRFETDLALEALERGGITVVSLVAVTLQRLVDGGWRQPRTVRVALVGGGPVASSLVERARGLGIPLSLTYGLTQACSQVATEPLADLGGGLQPLFATTVAVSPDGEILVKGPTVAPAELGDDGWLHTGDRGRIDGRGRVVVEGRLAETIISGGENVAPQEVEEALLAHPEVVEAGVYGRADSRWGEAVCAVVVTAGAVDPAQLRDHCRALLAPYKVPKQIAIVSGQLPRTASGKLRRRELAGLAELQGSQQA